MKKQLLIYFLFVLTPFASFAQVEEVNIHQTSNNDRALIISQENNDQKIKLHLANNESGQYGYFNLGGSTILRGNGQGSSFQGTLRIGEDLYASELFKVNGLHSDVIFNGTHVNTIWSFINTGTGPGTRLYIEDANYSSDRLTFNFRSNKGQLDVIAGTSTGNVGIGTTTPSAKLHVLGDIKTSYLHFPKYVTKEHATKNTNAVIGWSQSGILGGAGTLFIAPRTDITSAGIGFWTADPTNLDNGPVNRMYISSSGYVGIGTVNTSNYKLSVAGKIRAEEVKVYTNWADYVFEEDYKLKPLEEVEQHIKEYKHLPDVPSAKEVEENGVNLGESEAMLLRKIEELTLYLIEQNKEIDSMKGEINRLKNKLKSQD